MHKLQIKSANCKELYEYSLRASNWIYAKFFQRPIDGCREKAGKQHLLKMLKLQVSLDYFLHDSKLIHAK